MRDHIRTLSTMWSCSTHLVQPSPATTPPCNRLLTDVPNNGGTEESFARRRVWDAKMRTFLTARRAGPHQPLVWGGDLNVAAGWEDVGPDADWFRNKNGQGHRPEDCGQPGFTPAEQTRFADMLTAGELLDARRLTHPTPDWNRDCTWRGTPGAPPNPPEYGRYYGKGMRIDYVLLQRSLQVSRACPDSAPRPGPEQAPPQPGRCGRRTCCCSPAWTPSPSPAYPPVRL